MENHLEITFAIVPEGEPNWYHTLAAEEGKVLHGLGVRTPFLGNDTIDQIIRMPMENHDSAKCFPQE